MTPTWFFKNDKLSELMKVSMGSIFFQKGPEYAPTAEKEKEVININPKGCLTEIIRKNNRTVYAPIALRAALTAAKSSSWSSSGSPTMHN